jgi:hypothetical protein
MRISKALITAILTTLLAVTVTNANAVLMLEITDVATNTSVTVTDTDGDGKVAYGSWLGDNPINNWIMDFSVGNSKPAIGSENIDRMRLVNATITGGVGTLIIKLPDTDFDKLNTSFITGASGTTDGSVRVQTFLNESNVPGVGTETLLSDSGEINPSNGAGAFDFWDQGAINASSNYYLTMVSSITHDSVGQISDFSYVINVPEPVSLALLGLGLICMGVISRNKARNPNC